MKQPVIPFELHSKCLEVGAHTDEDYQEKIDEILESLPPVNCNVLAEILSMIREVIKNESKNKMGLENMAMLLSPSLLRHPQKLSLDIESLGKVSQSERSFLEKLILKDWPAVKEDDVVEQEQESLDLKESMELKEEVIEHSPEHHTQ